MTIPSSSARTQFLHTKNATYPYRRFGVGPGRPLLCLQHFMGTLDKSFTRQATAFLASNSPVAPY